MSKKAVISMSGGLDSTCLALSLLADGYEVKAYSFLYGQKHKIELSKLESNIKYLQDKGLPITMKIIDLRDVFNESTASLCGDGKNGEIPKADYDKESMKSTVIENRNVIFSSIIYSKALSWSKREDSNVEITLGIHGGDHALYPDCTEESQKAAEHLFKISNWGSEKVDYKAPFVNLTKAEVLNVGYESMRKLGFSEEDINEVLRNTHSCYDPDDDGRSCGVCGTCKERLEAFKLNGLVDPIEYRMI